MKTISIIAVGLFCAMAFSAFGAEAVKELPLNFSNVDVTKNIKRRFGAPHVAVNPKNPNNVVVVASSNMGYTKACLPVVAGSDCDSAALKIEGMPPLKQPLGFARTAGFMDIGVFVSFDRGLTFKQIDISGLVPPDDPMVRARGEGPIAVTPDGNFYIGFNAVNWGNWETTPQTFFPNGGVGVIKSTDGGLTWKWTSYSNTPADWPYGGADSVTGTFYVTSGIAGLTPLGPRSTGKADSPIGKIADRFISSTNDGYKWTDPQPLGGTDGTKHVGAGHSSVAAAHGVMATMFVVPSQSNCAFFVGNDAPANCVVFQTSTDAGKTWSRSRVPAPADFKTAPLALFVSADPTKKNHFTATLMNQSGADFLVYQTPDAGKTWSAGVRVTEDASKSHFAPYVAMSPKGEFGLMWRTHESDPSKPHAPDSAASREPLSEMGRGPSLPFSVWAVVSKDGGATFSQPLKISKANSPAPPDDPNDAFRIVGDHGPSGMAIDGFGGVHVVWADWTPGERAIYLSSINIKSFAK
jgi:hypothetical protein